MMRREAAAAVATRAANASSLHHLGRLASATEALARGGRARAPLRGRHVALLAAAHGDGLGDDGLDAIESAAAALGARTARPSLGHPVSDGDVSMLAGLYQLVCSDASLGKLSSRIRQLGVPVVDALLEPYHPVSLVALLLAVRDRVGDSAPVVLHCADPAHAAGAALAAEAAAVLRIPLRSGIAAPSHAWRLVTAPGGYGAWQLEPPAGLECDRTDWGRTLERMRELALQAALLQAVT